MDIETFLKEISGYYSRTNSGKVLSKIGYFMRRVKESEYERIYDDIIYTVPPSRIVGVAEIAESLKRLEIHLAPAVTREVESARVTCDCCGYEYLWAQSVTEEMHENHVFDACPRCKFPYYETWTMDRYAMIGRRKMWEPFYERMKEKYHTAWKAGPLVAHV